MTVSVFISYRRDDAVSEANLIAHSVKELVGDDLVFLDTSSIYPSENWPKKLKEKIQSAKIVIAVIGPNWIRVSDEWGRRRLDNPDDWVRKEIETALASKAKLFPILVKEARLPPPEVLPDSLQELTEKQVIELRSNYWDHDIRLLLSQLDNIINNSLETPSNQETTPEYLIEQANTAINLYSEGDISSYRAFINETKITNKLKRAALFETLRDLVQVDLESSIKTRHARSVLSYIQACLVLFELEPAIKICHKKLSIDPTLDSYSPIDKADFLRSYAELLNSAGKASLATSILESFLNSGIVSKLPHNRLSHLLSSLGECYLSINNNEDAYSIALDNHDEQLLTKNTFGMAISGTRLGIALLANNNPKEAYPLFESSAIKFKGFDLRACAWAEMYTYICSLRLNDRKSQYLESAMKFYSAVNHASRELEILMREAQSAKTDWKEEYNVILNRISEILTKNEVNKRLLNSAENFCAALISGPTFPGANALNHKVSNGEFRQNSILTSSFIRNLNAASTSEYLTRIISTENFYLRPFYNKLIRSLTYRHPDLVEKVIFPVIKSISESNDSFRVYYSRILEYHGFIKEADVLLESIEDKKGFRYFNNKGNILAHQRTNLDKALKYYSLAVEATNSDQEKSIALHNQAFAILRKKFKSRYEEAEELCKLSIMHRQNDGFYAPLQTLLLLRIDKEDSLKTIKILTEFKKEYSLSHKQLTATINQIKNEKKYQEAEKFLAH